MKTFFVIVWFLTATATFVLGYGWGVSERFESVEKIVLFDHNQQIRQAIYDGIPFKLKGTDVNLFPRKDGRIEVSLSAVKGGGIRQTTQ